MNDPLEAFVDKARTDIAEQARRTKDMNEASRRVRHEADRLADELRGLIPGFLKRARAGGVLPDFTWSTLDGWKHHWFSSGDTAIYNTHDGYELPLEWRHHYASGPPEGLPLREWLVIDVNDGCLRRITSHETYSTTAAVEPLEGPWFELEPTKPERWDEEKRTVRNDFLSALARHIARQEEWLSKEHGDPAWTTCRKGLVRPLVFPPEVAAPLAALHRTPHPPSPTFPVLGGQLQPGGVPKPGCALLHPEERRVVYLHEIRR